ncbi:MAG: SxtJ family membrane protein [candidate division KSB1 bacterium]|nr:SxtJ family membrane protein [candidate division KSB1 bacterium]
MKRKTRKEDHDRSTLRGQRGHGFRRLVGGAVRAWKTFARALGVAYTHILLFLVYWLVLGPAWLALRVAGKDYLRKRERGKPSYWLDREAEEHTLERAGHPF